MFLKKIATLLDSALILCLTANRAGGQPNSPAQVAQMLQGMNPAQRAQMAAAMGVSPQQLAQVRVNLLSSNVCAHTYLRGGTRRAYLYLYGVQKIALYTSRQDIVHVFVFIQI